VAELADGRIRTFTLTPEQVGLKRWTKQDLRGGEAAYNAQALRAMLGGAPGAFRDTVLMNAGAGLVVAGKAATLEEGMAAAADAIDSGKAIAVLDRLVKVSNESV
jgi:anthranilate phosphoribosyltransferase